jgi:hypothetical protein
LLAVLVIESFHLLLVQGPRDGDFKYLEMAGMDLEAVVSGTLKWLEMNLEVGLRNGADIRMI